MRAAYLAQDDPILSETAKSSSRRMKLITRCSSDWEVIFGKCPITVNTFLVQSMFNMIRVHVDKDNAGCAVTCRSTAGYGAVSDRHCVTQDSNMQWTISLSRRESVGS